MSVPSRAVRIRRDDKGRAGQFAGIRPAGVYHRAVGNPYCRAQLRAALRGIADDRYLPRRIDADDDIRGRRSRKVSLHPYRPRQGNMPRRFQLCRSRGPGRRCRTRQEKHGASFHIHAGSGSRKNRAAAHRRSFCGISGEPGAVRLHVRHNGVAVYKQAAAASGHIHRIRQVDFRSDGSLQGVRIRIRRREAAQIRGPAAPAANLTSAYVAESA